jgi:hypothetical protein
VLRDLLAADGHPDAERTADLLVALKDGLLVGADLDDPARRDLIRKAVTRILDGPAHAKGGRRASWNELGLAQDPWWVGQAEPGTLPPCW